MKSFESLLAHFRTIEQKTIGRILRLYYQHTLLKKKTLKIANKLEKEVLAENERPSTFITTIDTFFDFL